MFLQTLPDENLIKEGCANWQWSKKRGECLLDALGNSLDLFLGTLILLLFILFVFEGFSGVLIPRRKQRPAGENVTLFPWILLVLMLIFAVPALMMLFGLSSLIMGASCAVILTATAAMPSIARRLGKRHALFLERERSFSIVLVTLGFLLAESVAFAILSAPLSVPPTSADIMVVLLQEIAIGLGIGVMFGILIFSWLRRGKANWLVHLALIAAALLAAFVADYLGGSGILSVAVFALFFMNFSVAETAGVHRFSPGVRRVLDILAVILALAFLVIKWESVTLQFLCASLILLLVLIIVRFGALLLSKEASLGSAKEAKDALMLSVVMPKGSEALACALAISTLFIPSAEDAALIIIVQVAFAAALAVLVSFAVPSSNRSKKN